MLPPEQIIILATFALASFGGLTAATLTIRDLHTSLQQRERFIRQLLDRLATHEYAKNDGLIPRIFVKSPPSAPEDIGVVGPHGGGQNFQVAKEAPPKPKKPGKRLKLDLAEEFNRKGSD